MVKQEDFDFENINPNKLGQSIAFAHLNSNKTTDIVNKEFTSNPHSFGQRSMFRTGLGYCSGMLFGSIYGFKKCYREFKIMPTMKLKINSMTNHNLAWASRFGIVCGSFGMLFTFYEQVINKTLRPYMIRKLRPNRYAHHYIKNYSDEIFGVLSGTFTGFTYKLISPMRVKLVSAFMCGAIVATFYVCRRYTDMTLAGSIDRVLKNHRHFYRS